jgi:hydrogenase maturation protease
MHLATPERALMLARALRVLPPQVLMIGCQPVNAQDPGQGMSAPVKAAVEVAIGVIHGQLSKMTTVDPLAS